MTNDAMMIDPDINTGLRPSWSTQITAGMVASHILYIQCEYVFQGLLYISTYTMPTTPVARSETELPVWPRFWKIVGA